MSIFPVSGGVPYEESDAISGSPKKGTSSEHSTVQPSDKAKIEEILAMLPKTWLDPILALQTWSAITANFGLQKAGSTEPLTVEQMAGSVERSIVLAMMLAFQKNENMNEELTKEDNLRRDASKEDPVRTALRSYIANDKGTALSPDMLGMIQTSPLLLNSLRSVDPVLVVEAYQIALKTIVPNMLEDLIARNEAIGGDQNNASSQLARTYLEEVRTNGLELTQPMVSIVFAGMVGGSAMQVPLLIDPKTGITKLDTSKDSILPAGQGVISDMVSELGAKLAPQAQAELAQNLSQFVANTQTSGAYWSTPGAVTLSQKLPGQEKIPLNEASIRSYAMTVAQFTLSGAFNTFAEAIIRKSIPTISEDKLQTAVASLKIILLSNALAALDKITMQSVVIRAPDIEDMLAGKVKLDEGDFRFALVKLINEQYGLITSDVSRKALQERMRVYFDKNPDLESLTNFQEMFLELIDPKNMNSSRLAA